MPGNESGRPIGYAVSLRRLFSAYTVCIQMFDRAANQPKNEHRLIAELSTHTEQTEIILSLSTVVCARIDMPTSL